MKSQVDEIPDSQEAPTPKRSNKQQGEVLAVIDKPGSSSLAHTTNTAKNTPQNSDLEIPDSQEAQNPKPGNNQQGEVVGEIDDEGDQVQNDGSSKNGPKGKEAKKGRATKDNTRKSISSKRYEPCCTLAIETRRVSTYPSFYLSFIYSLDYYSSRLSCICSTSG